MSGGITSSYTGKGNIQSTILLAIILVVIAAVILGISLLRGKLTLKKIIRTALICLYILAANFALSYFFGFQLFGNLDLNFGCSSGTKATEPQKCLHEIIVYEPFSEDAHFIICDKCNSKLQEENHVRGKENYSSDGHWYYCSSCHVEFGHEEHNWDYDEGKGEYCLDCDYYRK